MKRILSLSFACVLFALAGCASGGTSAAPSAANTPMTLDEALQKSAETRQKLLDAKKQYEAAKAASESGQSVSSAVAKQTAQNKIDAAKQKLADEKQAWKDALAD